MPTNSYFRNFDAKNEQELLHSLVTESIQIYGHDVNYIPRTLVKEDDILGEDSISEYKDAYSIEMYIKSVDGFEGEGDLVSKFGLEVRDQIVFSVARRAWEGLDLGVRPKEGDLIYFPLTDKLFQIMFVEHETPFYQKGALPTFDLTCELFTYSHEDIDTGITEVDDIERQFGYAMDIVFVRGSGDFVVDELVNNSTTSAKVLSWDSPTKTLRIGNITGNVITNAFFTGATSGASWSMQEAPTVIQDQNMPESLVFTGDTSTSPSTDVYTWQEAGDNTIYNSVFDTMQVRYGDGIFIAATYEKIWSSVDGTTWTLRKTLDNTVTGSAGSHTLTNYASSHSFIPTNERLHYDGSDFYFTNRNSTLRSTDGLTWTDLNAPNDGFNNANPANDGILSNGSGKLMLLGSLGIVRYSEDYGATWWEYGTMGMRGLGYAQSYQSGAIRAGFYYNDNGTDTWVVTDFFQYGGGTNSDNNIHVMTSGFPTSSSDVPEWTHHENVFGPASDNIVIRGITYTGQKWIAVGYRYDSVYDAGTNGDEYAIDDPVKIGNPSSTDTKGVIYTSDNVGGTWTKQSLISGLDQTDLFYDVRYFVVGNITYTFVLGTGVVLLSKDHGSTWIVLENNTNISENIGLKSIAWDGVTGENGKLIIGGNDNYISSPYLREAYVIEGSTTPAAIPPAPDTQTIVTDTQADNKKFEIDADSVLDFTEGNPFGDNP